MDDQPGEVGQQLLRQPVRLRMEAGAESCGRETVDSHGCLCNGNRAGCSRSVEEARPHDVYDRPGTQDGPGLWADFEAFPREPAGVCRCLRPGVVQADTPRHGAPHAMSGPVGAC